jgi:hypothetical protein
MRQNPLRLLSRLHNQSALAVCKTSLDSIAIIQKPRNKSFLCAPLRRWVVWRCGLKTQMMFGDSKLLKF